MGLETVTKIADLNPANPAPGDAKNQGDDHIRNIKLALKTDLPNITGPITVTQAEINRLAGVSSNVQTQINTLTTNTNNQITALSDSTTAALATKVGSHSPAFTGVPTAPTAAPGSSGAQLATLDFANNLAFSGVLPAQTGNAGKTIITNGTTASWGSVGIKTAPFVGGALDNGVYNALLSAANYTMPDLRTATDTFGLVTLGNTSSAPATVATSDGWTIETGFSAGTLGAIAPYSRDTAHGTWGSRLMTPPLLATIAGGGTVTIFASVLMGDVLVVFFGDGAFKAVAIDLTTNTAGAPVTIRASTVPATVAAYQDAAGTLAVGYKITTNATFVSALSLSGTTLTAGTAVQVGTTAPDCPMVRLQAGSYLASAGGTQYAITVSGTTCTVGAGVNAFGPSGQIYGVQRLTSTTALIGGAVSGTGPKVNKAAVLTVSGTTTTIGTVADSPTALSSNVISSVGLVPFDATNFLLYGRDNTTSTTANFYALAVSGTTVTFGAVTASANNAPGIYTPVTYAYAPGQPIAPFSATQILFGNLAGPYVVTLSGTTIAVGAPQLTGQTSGTFLRDFANSTWFYVGSTAFDRFTVSGATIASAEQVASAPTSFLTQTVNNRSVKYGATWYAWNITITLPVATTKALHISGSNINLHGSIT